MFVLKQLRSEHHQNGFIGDLGNVVPIFRREQQTLIGSIEDKPLLLGTGVIGNKATSFQTNDRLLHILAISSTLEMVRAVHVENALDFERNYTFDHGEAPAGVRKGFQVD